MKIKKLICLLAALALMIPTFASCAEDFAGGDETAGTDVTALTETEPVETVTQPVTTAETETKAPTACELNGHSWKVTQDRTASCTRDGQHTMKCTVCGEQEAEELPMLGHEFADGVCTRCGLLEGAEARFRYSFYSAEEGYSVSGYIKSDANSEYGAKCREETAALKSILLPNVCDTWNAQKKAHDYNKVTRVCQLFDIPCACETLIVPEGYTYMSRTCMGWDKLTSVSLPSTLTVIFDETFRDCRSLTEIVLPDSVTTIGENAFYNCVHLKRIVIPDSVTTIEAGAFEGCYSLEEVVLPAGLKQLPDRLFSGCSSLKSVNVPEGLTGIGSNCVLGCASLPKEIRDQLQPKR